MWDVNLYIRKYHTRPTGLGCNSYLQNTYFVAFLQHAASPRQQTKLSNTPFSEAFSVLSVFHPFSGKNSCRLDKLTNS